MAITNIKINWFIVSKHAMDRQDYRILAGNISDPEPWRVRFKNWIKEEVPLEATATCPGAPFYYFIPEVIEGILCQVLVRQLWSNYTDKASRRVLTSTCLVIPYDVFQKHPCGFKQQAGFFELPAVKELLANAQLAIWNGKPFFTQQSPEITLIDRSDVEEYFLTLLSEYSLGFSQATGTNLANGKNVCIWERNEKISDINQRLRWLDASLIALPYGVRANCSASTWQSTYTETGDRLVVGRRSNPNIAYLSPDVAVEKSQLCEGYAAGISRLLENGRSPEELVSTFLRLTNPVNFNTLRYGPQDLLPISPQERVTQLLINPDEYDTEANQRALIGKIKSFDPNEVKVEDLQALLVQTLPVLENSDAPLIRQYWSDDLLTQATNNFKSGNNKILDLLPLIIPDNLSEERFRQVIGELWDHTIAKATSDLEELRRFFKSLHRFCCNRAQTNSPQLELTINTILQKIGNSGRIGYIASLIWMRFVLSSGANYQKVFFEALRLQLNLREPLSIFSNYWEELKPGQARIDQTYYPNLLILLTKISLIRNPEKQETVFLQSVLNNLIRRHSQRATDSNPDFQLILPLLDRDFWADYHQNGEVAALIDEICFVVKKRWEKISTLKKNDQNIDSYRTELSRFLNQIITINPEIIKSDMAAIRNTLTSLDKTKSQIKSQEMQTPQQSTGVNENTPTNSVSKPDNEKTQVILAMESGEQEIEQRLNEDCSTFIAVQPSDSTTEIQDIEKLKIEPTMPQFIDTRDPNTDKHLENYQDEMGKFKQDIPGLAQSAADKIEKARSNKDMEIWKTIWEDIANEVGKREPSLSPEELEHFLLLLLGSIKDGDIRKETLSFLLPVLLESSPVLNNPVYQSQFFQYHSEFVDSVVRSYCKVFSGYNQFNIWIEHISKSLSLPDASL